MKAKSRRAAETRWLYRIEREFLHTTNDYANRTVSMKRLNRLAKRVWENEAPKGRRFPTIEAGKGVYYGDAWLSYCMGYTEIVLARGQRTILVLLHELTHALGPCVHGPKFVRLYFYLLRKYARFNQDFLQGVAAGRGIVLN